ncbi:MAG: hypothetical protein QFF03_22735 [Pseudomonadota bacterium]|nr:hypothetical protein [Pseudomonadota bacterium]
MSARREWTACRAILMHAVNQRRAEGTLWLSWILIALAFGGCYWASTAGVKADLALALGVGVPLGMLALTWWVVCFSSIVVQCNPIAMHLAPDMRARARRVLIAVWAVITIAMTLSVGVPTGYPGQVAVFTGLALMEVSATFNIWRIVALVAANWLLWHAGPQVAYWYETFLKSDGAVVLGVLLVLLDGRIALRRTFGGPRRLPMAAAIVDQQDIPTPIARLKRVFQAISGDQAHGRPLFSQVLGPQAFGGERLVLALLVAVCVAMRSWIALRGGGDAHAQLFVTRCGVLVVVLMLLELLTASVARGFANRAGEQALVRLAPSAPPSASFNRVLARYFLLRYAAMWSICSALALAALWILGANAGELARAAAACTFALVMAGVPLADYAHRRDFAPHAQLLHVFLSGAILAAAVTAVGGDGSVAQWSAAATASVVTAGLFTWYRWRAMLAAPPAFPAGRLG